MNRFQKGNVEQRSNAFYSRYYETTIEDGKPKRVRRSMFIAYKDQKYYATNSIAVKLKHAGNMLLVNNQQSTKKNQQESQSAAEQTRIVDFWDETYFLFAQENLRHSTVSGYAQIWKQHLKDHFAQMTLKEYRTHFGSLFLTGLKKKLGRRTLAHIRSLASGIFSHAVNVGLLESNPWHDVKILGKVRDPGNTPHYTLEEAENIISALAGRVDCQLIISLSFFLGLRPSEIIALRWEDFDAEQVHIRRACVRGHVGECKTPESVASLPLIGPVLVPLNLWRYKSGNPSEGWLFPNQKGNPLDMRDFVRHSILPLLEAKKVEWKGLYAGRRGAATMLVDLTGGLVSAQELLRHKSQYTLAQFYKKRTQNALANGMRLLEEAAGEE